MPSKYKWPESAIVSEFRCRDAESLFDKNRFKRFQALTNDMEECVTWVINSKKNDIEQRRRAAEHMTGYH